jgi:hypothetical protein
MSFCVVLKQTRGGTFCEWVRDRSWGEVAPAIRGRRRFVARVAGAPGCGRPELARYLGVILGGRRAWGDIRRRPYVAKPRAGLRTLWDGPMWASRMSLCARRATDKYTCRPGVRALCAEQRQSRAHGRQARAASCRA